MRKLIVIIVVLAGLYGGYWFVGKSQIQTRLNDALIQIDTGPYAVSFDTLKTRGFPSRFDTTITDLTIEDPLTFRKWSAPLIQLLALSYRPNEVIAIFPDTQTITLNDQVYTLITDDMRASGKVRPNATLAFQTATIEMDNPRLRNAAGSELVMASILAAMRLTPQTTQTYDAFFEAHNIILPDEMRRVLDPQTQQPPVIQNLRFDSDVILKYPLELNAQVVRPTIIESLTINELALTWGEMSLAAIGDVTPDDDGILNGSITISLANWQQVFNLAVAGGMIKEERRFLVNGLAGTLDETPHIADTLTVTLMMTNGEMTLGGFPLGSLPIWR